MTPPTRKLSGTAFATLLLIALMMGANHVAARLAFNHGVDVATAVTFRSAVTALVLGALLLAQRVPLTFTARHRRALPAIGLLIGVAEPVPVFGRGAAAGGAGPAGLQHLPAVDRAVGAPVLRPPARARGAGGHAGDAGGPGAGAGRVRRRLGPGRGRPVGPHRRRRGLCADGSGHLRRGAGADAARSQRPGRPGAHLLHHGHRRRAGAGGRGLPGRLSLAPPPCPAGGGWRR